MLLRPEVIGTVLVVLAAAAVPSVIPLTGVIGEARDGIIAALGLHVFTTIALLAALGAVLALRRADLLRSHLGHIVGVALLLLFVAGLLARWHPETRVGGVDLHEVSAGGALGRLFTGGPWWLVAWLALAPLGYALLWPRTAWSVARATPPATWETLKWLWGLGLHRRAGAALASLVRRRPPEEIDDLRDVEDEGGPPAPKPSSRPRAAAADPAPALDDVAAAKAAAQLGMDLDTPVAEQRDASGGWQLPPIKMLTKVEVPKSAAVDNERRARLIEQTLASFGVDATVVEVNEGPAITQFGVEPGWDVKTKMVPERDASGRPIFEADGTPRASEVEVSRTRIRVNRITALQTDLALALASPALRVEAPVPGKAMVGIEVPNGSTSIVSLRSVMESPAFQKFVSKAALPVALGQGVSGEPVFADLAKMPHLLIAGATGSGKSVCLNTIITGLLMNYSPEQLRFVMVDPKRVELTSFGKIPHLAFSEIVVEMDRVVGTLQAVINEMDTRYRRFAQEGVRNIERFNEKNPTRRLPYWVVVIDELADLMMAVPYQVEHQLVRLAQLARATGIHLIVATQRPSVDVITGLIKANFPTRIAFAVSSMVDSRTILDQSGAEKLLGKGDMLYVPFEAQKPKRVQGVYVSDDEIESVVKFWTQPRFGRLAPDKYDDALAAAIEEAASITEGDGPEAASGGDDQMLAKAVEVAQESRTLSTSMLQRKLGIGYPRAARLMDLLEERGVVAAAEPGGKAREVLLTRDGDPLGGMDARQPASLAAHAASITMKSPTKAEARRDPPRPFDAD
ncbi:MAG: DNA translocase FtsK [Chloroflexi bacterium]|nr:DNA translocase FtsK [Chloroflexota bacterium]